MGRAKKEMATEDRQDQPDDAAPEDAEREPRQGQEGREGQEAERREGREARVDERPGNRSTESLETSAQADGVPDDEDVGD